MMRRLRDAIRSKDESTKLADIALRDEIAAFDLVSSLGSADEGVRETASKAIAEVARRDYDKLLSIVLHWSGERHYKISAFLKWTDGLESRNLDRLKVALADRVKSATLVDQIVNEYDAVNEKNDRLESSSPKRGSRSRPSKHSRRSTTACLPRQLGDFLRSFLRTPDNLKIFRGQGQDQG